MELTRKSSTWPRPQTRRKGLQNQSRPTIEAPPLIFPLHRQQHTEYRHQLIMVIIENIISSEIMIHSHLEVKFQHI